MTSSGFAVSSHYMEQTYNYNLVLIWVTRRWKFEHQVVVGKILRGVQGRARVRVEQSVHVINHM